MLVSLPILTWSVLALTGPLAEEERDNAFISRFFLLTQDSFDDLVALVHVPDSLSINLELLHFLGRRFPSGVGRRMEVGLLDRPDFGDVVLDPLESFERLQERVHLVRVMDVRVAFPFDMEALGKISAFV